MLALLPLLVVPLALGDGPTARFPKGIARMELGPPPAQLEDWSAERCASCHPREAEAWRQSGHATARVGFVFQAGLRHDSPGWCVGCHAPLASRFDRSVPDAAAPAEERGVTCAACHAVEGAVGTVASGSAGAPHATRATAALRDGEVCAGCHQFGFAVHDASGALVGLSEHQAQQDTAEEWRRWSEATGDPRTCADCHMPSGDHALGGVHRVEAIRRAIEVRVVEGGAALEVRTTGVGHAMPTGDVMRWISVEVSSDAFFEHPVEVATFGRALAFRRWPGESLPRVGILQDRALPPSGAPPVLVPLPRGARFTAWRLIYHLVSAAQERDGDIPAGISRAVLQAGSLPRSPRP